MATNNNNSIPEIWSDLHQNLVADSHGNLKKVINEEAVKTSINNILGTFLGERVFLPEFGSTLRSLVFEPVNTNLLDRFSDDVKNMIEKWDDRVIVQGVSFVLDPDHNYVSLTVRFNIKSYTEVFNHTTTITQ